MYACSLAGGLAADDVRCRNEAAYTAADLVLRACCLSLDNGTCKERAQLIGPKLEIRDCTEGRARNDAAGGHVDRMESVQICDESTIVAAAPLLHILDELRHIDRIL